MHFKRAFDFFLSLIMLIITFPLMGLTALLILITMGKPVLFKQQRPGLYGRPFTIYKFRTMNNLRDRNGKLLPDEKRLTKVGRWIRKLSLDELPQLFNVLKGDMSFVGPRPLLMEYIPRYTQEQARRHEVKPGITGWAQVNGRNATTWEERFRLDVWYVDNRSFWLDMKIILLTIREVLKRRGISAPGFETMPEFLGIEEKGD
ncbi:MAG TPA: sugar transferase [Syntrophales bacterium]|nr:sugar transferase [Syntrophales bacterium]HOL60162.1 sugar transferase [Syntrophales bacterium]HPO36269.1 sugar transferase [Syntrophales bacterium]